jgi:hypothetical protein
LGTKVQEEVYLPSESETEFETLGQLDSFSGKSDNSDARRTD